VLWQRRDLPCNHFRGPGSSPILFEDLLILTLDGFDEQYLVALDKRTGKKVWRTDRSFDFGDLDGDLRKAYSTPLLVEVSGDWRMYSCGAKAAYAYEPRTGRELWMLRYRGFSNASRPVFGAGLIFINTGFSKADLWAVRPGGTGDITDTHVAWKQAHGIPLKPSPVWVGDRLYLVNDSGIATCLAAATGEVVWQHRVKGRYSASPLYGAGRIYVFSEEGRTTVLRPGDTFEKLAENDLEEGFMASPAVAGRALILRTKTHLYRIEE
jgi:outer membrane protein assembly factor BamB